MGVNEAAQVQTDADDAIFAVATTFAVANKIWDVIRTTSAFRGSVPGGSDSVVGQITALVYRTRDMARAGSVSEASIPNDQYSFMARLPLAVGIELGDRLRGTINDGEMYAIKTFELSDVNNISGLLERSAIY